MAKEMFESFTRESSRWKMIVDNINQGISNAVASLLSQRLRKEEMTTDNLKVKLEEFFQLNVYGRDDFENFSIFSNTITLLRTYYQIGMKAWEKQKEQLQF